MAGRPINVLWLAKGLGPGGMERLLETHARVGDRDAFTYHAAYLVDRPHSVVPALADLGVEATKLGNDNDLDVRWAAQLRQLVRDRAIDVVHVHSPMAAAVARPALRAMRRRPGIVYTEHNSWDCYSRATRLANAVTYVLDDAQVAVSIAAAESPPAAIGGRVEVLTHGIDRVAVASHLDERDEVRAELGLDPGAFVVATVANLRREKGYDVLLAAAAAATARHPELVFLSIGQGPLEAELEAEHLRLALGDRFRFLGFRPDVHRLLAAADLFALASRHEGLPVALMEASALGLPIVATRVGGLPDVIDEGVSGLLVGPDDAPALAAAIGSVVDDAGLRKELSAGALAMSDRFDARTAVGRLEALYRQVAR